jgi:O-acetyl-ADP-ribose deacetylase (regulator of RNase III)
VTFGNSNRGEFMHFVKGDILDAKDGIIGHQVNCQMVMGAGLAKQIRDKYPRVYDEYMLMVGKSPITARLGRCQMVAVSDKLLVANLFGQFDYRPRNKVHTDYTALSMALRNLQRWKDTFVSKDFPIYLPYGLGCGLAGGDWKIVEGIIRGAIPDANIVRYDKAKI